MTMFVVSKRHCVGISLHMTVQSCATRPTVGRMQIIWMVFQVLGVWGGISQRVFFWHFHEMRVLWRFGGDGLAGGRVWLPRPVDTMHM